MKFFRVFCPGKFPAVDDDAAQRIAVPAHVLRQRIDHDIRTPFDRLDQHGRRHRVVNDQRNPFVARQVCEGLDVDDVAGRVADGLAIEGLRVVIDQFRKFLGTVVLAEAHVDALARQHVLEERVGAAVEQRDRDDVVTLFGDIEDRVVDGGAPRAHRKRRDTFFELRAALLQHVGRRVHDARVDIALDLEIEEVGAMLCIVERVGDGLVDGHGYGPGFGIRFEAGVDCECFVFHGESFCEGGPIMN